MPISEFDHAYGDAIRVGFVVSLFPDAVLTAPPDPHEIQSRYGG